MTGDRSPSASAQLMLRKDGAEDRFTREEEEEEESRPEGVTVDEGRAALRLWQARRKSCVQFWVFQGCPHVAQGSGLVKEWKRK